MLDDRRRRFLDEVWGKLRDKLTEEEIQFFKKNDFAVVFDEEQRAFISGLICKYGEQVIW